MPWGDGLGKGGCGQPASDAKAHVRQPPASWLPPDLHHHGSCTHCMGEVTGKNVLYFSYPLKLESCLVMDGDTTGGTVIAGGASGHIAI